MGKLEDVDLSKSNVDKHIFVLKAGTPVYRVTLGPYDPTIPTGQANRCAMNPYGVTSDQYQEAYANFQGAVMGTGNIFCSFAEATALKEFAEHHNADQVKAAVTYKITFTKDVPFVDTESLCLAAGVNPVPEAKKRHPFYHHFYGPPIQAQALKLRSAVDLNGMNIVFYPVNIPGYANIVTKEECKKNE